MNKQEIDKIYNDFPPEGRDMSRAEFHKEIQELLDPIKMSRDLDAIAMKKAQTRSAQIRAEQINRRISKQEK